MADTQYSLRGSLADARFLAACESVLGVAPPSAANTVASDIYWLGPDEWLVSGRAHERMARLREALAGVHSVVVDVSSARSIIELEGADAEDVLSSAVTLDLHPKAFPVGTCAQTTIARTQGLIFRKSETAFRLFVRPSFARYLRAWLDGARTA